MIGQTISHYKILEKLGEGGMGVVYKAEDTKLKRTVALKFLPPDITRDKDAKTRFIHEAQAASALQHNNICTIHEIDETKEAQLFISMDCYDGETLEEKIERGPLSIEEALDVVSQVAEGLSKAHESGMIHRDIKPANIMMTKDGVAKILDFGLAKLAGQTKVTKTGTTVGTVAYMSPEHARGEAVDCRTDIWSLGVILYEMLSGQLPFKGDYEQALIYLILHEDPEPLIPFRSDIPDTLRQVVGKALEKDRSNRYQNVQALLEDLRIASSPGMILPKHENSIVVLPFEDISPGKDNEYFSDGLTEEIITDLSQIHDLRVISRNSAMMLKGTQKDTKTIGRELNVQYILEGSVRKAGNDLRITAQLIDATRDKHIWAKKYKGTLDDIFDIQEKVSHAIVDALMLKLTPDEEKRMAERPIDNVEAYDFYLKAYQEFWQFTENALDRGLRYLQHAADIIGDNDLLYSAMALVYWQYGNISSKQEDYVAKAEEYAHKALALNPDSSKALHVMGLNMLAFHGNPQQAASYFKRALAIEPSLPGPLMSLAGVFCYCGKIPAAVQIVDRLKNVNPLSPQRYYFEGFQHFYDGNYDLALEPLRQSYQMDPPNPIYYFYYAWTLAYNTKFDEAFSIIEQGAKAHLEDNLSKSALLLKYALLKDKEKAFQTMTPDFQKACRRRGAFSHIIAVMMALLDEKEQALDWLENAVDRGFLNYPILVEKDPWLETIRGEERFKKLLQRAKYEWEHFEV